MPSNWLWFQLVPLIVLVNGSAGIGLAGEPQVAFLVKQGWLDFRVEKEGVAVPDVQVQTYDSLGLKIAEGETGAEGRGSFPLPPGSRFRIDLKMGDRMADPIWLTRVGADVVPNEVLLSFGLRPCCRVTALKPGEKNVLLEPPSIWLPLISLAILVVVGIKIGLVIFITSHPAAKTPQLGDPHATRIGN